jgi:hypothetical protein
MTCERAEVPTPGGGAALTTEDGNKSSFRNAVSRVCECRLTIVRPPNIVPLEKLVVAQLRKKFFVFYGLSEVITVFTKARQWTYPVPAESNPHFTSIQPITIHFNNY